MVGAEDEEQACARQSPLIGSGKYQWDRQLGWVSNMQNLESEAC